MTSYIINKQFTLPKQAIYTFAPSQSNQITKSYYNFLVGEINRGIILKAVLRIENKTLNKTSYYLISQA